MSEIVPKQEFSRTSAVLGMEFDACSFVAREANEQAEQLLAGKTHRETLHIIQDPEAGSAVEKQFDVIDLQSTKLDYAIDDTAQLKLVQPRGVKRRHKDIGTHARLVAVVRGDIAVPIAGFARRKTESGCDFVQLEDEMHDENYVILPRDARSDLVKAITAAMRGEPTPHQEHQVRSMTQKALGRNAERIEEELAPALVREIHSYLDHAMPADSLGQAYLRRGGNFTERYLLPSGIAGEFGSFIQELSLVKDNSEKVEPMRVRYVKFGDVILPDRRRIQLAFMRSEEQPSTAYLAAITRKSVAIPLIEFPESDEAIMSDADHDNNTELVRALLHKYPSRRVEEMYGLIKSSSGFVLDMGIKEAWRRHFYKNRFVDHLEYRPNTWTPLGDSLEVHHYTLESLHAEDLVQVLNIALGHNNRYVQQVLAKFNVQDRFTELLGEYNVHEEAFFRDLGKIAAKGSRFTGRLEGFRVNGEETDVDVFAEITEENGGNRLLIRGRPAVYREHRPRVLYDTVVHPAHELGLDRGEIIDLQKLIGSLGISISRFGGGEAISKKASSANAIWE
jgi:hypothetical protein